MKLDKENTKQIIKIVVIAIVLLVALLNIEPVWNVCKTFFSILSPFICGLAIAFILMRFYEEKLFKTKKKRKNNSKEITQSEKNNPNNNIMTKASSNVINKTNLEKENKQNKDNKNENRRNCMTIFNKLCSSCNNNNVINNSTICRDY